MQDYTITQLRVQDVTGLDASAQPTVTKRVTFNIGKHGPFTVTYKASEYSADAVKADIEKEAATLRAIDAIATVS
jgi:hypothetical protein